MRVVSIGDLVLDYYYKDSKLLGVCGGMSSHNIIANLAKKGLNTAVYGVCGNDDQGLIAIKSLEKLKVDISGVKKINSVRTRCFHVSYFEENGHLSFLSKKRCPYCNNKKWYDESLLDTKAIISSIKNDDILVFDNLNIKNQFIIDNTNNIKIIDIGQYFEFESLSDEELCCKISGKFDIVNFNERVTNYLLKRFKMRNEIELYNLFRFKLMLITRGEKGANFIYNDKVYDFSLINKGSVVDSTGAGDAFLSSIIRDFIKNELIISPDLFEKWYDNSCKLTTKVVSKMGARGHLYSLFKIKKAEESCTCEKFIYNERKKIKRCNLNVNNLETRVINAINNDDSNKLNDIIFNKNSSFLFIGTGGSFAGANFASKVINHLYGCNTYALYPRDVLYRNNDSINDVFLFSYSGTTNDLLKSVINFDNDRVYLITKGNYNSISKKIDISKKNIISYRTSNNKGKERGFLSFEGAVAPSAIFLKYYLNKTYSDIMIDDFIKSSINYWEKEIGLLINKKMVDGFKKHNIINIFRGDFGDTASFDLESKIIESGIFNCIVHEKKNFSHGRFINFENLNNYCSIFFKQKETTTYEKELLNYLGNNNVLIESKYNGLLAEFDLLIASQFIIYYIGKCLDIDVSKPSFSEDAMKIYFYKGDL